MSPTLLSVVVHVQIIAQDTLLDCGTVLLYDDFIFLTTELCTLRIYLHFSQLSRFV